VNCWFNACRGRDKGVSGVFAHREGLVEGPGTGDEVWSVRRGGTRLVCNSNGDRTAWVAGSGETEREKAVRFAEDVGSYVAEGCCNGLGVWVRGGGLPRSKKGTLGTWEGGRPLFNWRGDRTCNLLGGRVFANFLFFLATRASA